MEKVVFINVISMLMKDEGGTRKSQIHADSTLYKNLVIGFINSERSAHIPSTLNPFNISDSNYTFFFDTRAADVTLLLFEGKKLNVKP